MQTRLTELIHSLELLNDHPRTKKKINELIHVLNNLNRQKRDFSDNQVASYFITIITALPELMQHPKNHALKQLGKKLNPTHLQLPQWVIETLFDQVKQKADAVKRIKNR